MEDVLELHDFSGEPFQVRHSMIKMWHRRGNFTEIRIADGDRIIVEEVYDEVTRRIALAVDRSDRNRVEP